MKKTYLAILILLISTGSTFSSRNKNQSLPIFATYISDYDQECKAEALIKSIRLFAGTAKNAEILVCIDNRYNYSDKRLNLEGVKILQIDQKVELLKLPYSIKAYAAAAAEKLVKGKTDLLFWFDPETIVVGELKDLMLSNGKSIALRPVFLPNKVAIKANQQPDLLWTEIFKQAKVDSTQVYDINTVLENVPIKAYFNCGVMSVNPSLRLFQKWAELQTEMLNRIDYIEKALVDFPHQIFFHQAVFTAVVVANTNTDQIQWLSLGCAYPLNLFERMPAEKKINNLNQVNSFILEDVWNKNPKWLEAFSIEPDKKSQLEKLFINFNNSKIKKE